jgi:ABC-type branched-subunit amino acid transport system substrate-binding protein
MRSLVARRWMTVVFVLAVVSASCSVHKSSTTSAKNASKAGAATGSQSKSSDSSSSGFSPPTTVAKATSGSGEVVPPDLALDANAATDRGISADTITIGSVVFKENTFAQFGVTANGKRAETVLKPFVDDINEHGGINGKRLLVAVTRYSPLIPADLQSACVEQSEDYKVFATLAGPGFGPEGEVCMASKQTPVITTNNSSAHTLNERTLGWVRETVMNKDRMAKNWVDWLISSKTVSPANRIGIIYAENPEDTPLVTNVLVPYLKEKKLNIVEQIAYSGTTADTVTAESQNAILKFKTKGVDVVLPDLDFLRTASFVTTADSGNYHPKYVVSDLGLLSTDFTTSFYPAGQWTGTTAVTSYVTGQNVAKQLPTTTSFKECQSIYNAHGETFTSDPANVGAEVVAMMYYCEHLHLFAQVAKLAGTNLNRASFLGAFSKLGTWSERVTLTNPLTYGPQKFDGVDDFAVVKWQPACYTDKLGCYRLLNGFAKGNW